MPRTAPSEDWEQRRSRLNHDWLKNRHLNRLDGILALLVTAAPSPDPLDEFRRDDLSGWERRTAEVRALLASFDVEMSPRVLFAAPPLCQLPLESRAWLGARLHELWLAGTGAAALIETAREALGEAERAAADLRARLDGTAPLTGAAAVAARGELEAFRDTCRRLAETLAALPHEIVVP